MPLFGKKEFKPLDIPGDVGPDTDVFYLPATKEVFVDYDAYFERIVHLNSSVWTCSITARPGLTFEEAQQNEETALKQIEEFPSALERPILYAIHHFSCRCRLEDLVNDISIFIKDRFFVNEELFFKSTNNATRRTVRVLSVSYAEVQTGSSVGTARTSLQANSKTKTATSKRTADLANGGDEDEDDSKKKILPPELSPAECYRYKVQVVESDESSSSSSEDSDEENVAKKNGNKANKSSSVDVYDNVKFSQLSRGRTVASKLVVKLIIKHYTELTERQITVKKELVNDFMLDSMEWTSIFAGPLPTFQQTRRAKPVVAPKKEKKPSSITSTAKENEKDKKLTTSSGDAKENRKRLPSDLSDSSRGESKAAVRQKLIFQQQEELAPLISTAEKCGVEDIGRWKQNFIVLSDDDIQNLKETIKEAKEMEKKKVIEKRRKEKEEMAERKKPRDDLQCDDLKPLPKFDEFILPKWIPTDLYSDLLSVHNFFCCFADLLTNSGKNPFSLNTIAIAVLTKSANNRNLVKVVKFLLRARAECIDEEDGDEAEVNKANEIGNENSVFELTPKERLKFIQRIIQQLLSYQKFRETIDDRINIIYDLRRELRNLREWDRAQERDARDAHFIKEAMAKTNNEHSDNSTVKQSGLNGVVAENGEKKEVPKKPSKELLSLRNYLKCLNEGRSKRMFNDTETKRMILESMPFSEMDLHEIDEFRELQRELFREKLSEYHKQLFVLQARTGQCFLGRDRAFRSYFYLHQFFMFFIENPRMEDVVESCGEPTPLNNETFDENNQISEEGQLTNGDAFALKNGTSSQVDTDEERILRLACTGKPENCPVHNSSLSDEVPKYYYFVEKSGIEHLLGALNPRGFREIELSENIHYFKEFYEQKMEKLVEKMEKNPDDFLRKHFELAVDNDKAEEEFHNTQIVYDEEEQEEEEEEEDEEKYEEEGDEEENEEEETSQDDDDTYDVHRAKRSRRAAPPTKGSGVSKNATKPAPSTRNRAGVAQKSSSAIASSSLAQNGNSKSFKNNLVNGYEYEDADENAENGLNGRKRRVAAKRYIDYLYSDERSATEESGSESPASFDHHAKLRKSSSSTTAERALRKRKPPSSATEAEPFNYRHLSMGLRESDDQRKSQLKKCEDLIREAMGKPFGEHFAFPVDAKFVPTYHDVIKNPMDLRTMINKLKGFEYNSPMELWTDCELMFDNCVEFNEEESPIRQDAIELRHFLKPRFEEIFGKSI